MTKANVSFYLILFYLFLFYFVFFYFISVLLHFILPQFIILFFYYVTYRTLHFLFCGVEKSIAFQSACCAWDFLLVPGIGICSQETLSPKIVGIINALSFCCLLPRIFKVEGRSFWTELTQGSRRNVVSAIEIEQTMFRRF